MQINCKSVANCGITASRFSLYRASRMLNEMLRQSETETESRIRCIVTGAIKLIGNMQKRTITNLTVLETTHRRIAVLDHRRSRRSRNFDRGGFAGCLTRIFFRASQEDRQEPNARNSVLQVGEFICRPVEWNFPTGTVRFAESIREVNTRICRLASLLERRRERKPSLSPGWLCASVVQS